MVETDRTIEWVWLDLDDTLIDFHANSDAALRRVYAERGLCRYYNNVEEWLDSYHEVNAQLWQRYNRGDITQQALRVDRFLIPHTRAGMPEDEALKASQEMDPTYLDYLAQEKRTIPGARELLVELRRQGYKTGVLSNGFNGVQQKKLVSAGLDALIDLTVLSDEIGVNKPDERLYRYAMERAGCPDPSRHLMIGDNPDTDIAGALNAGWSAILFNPNPQPTAADLTQKFAEISSLADVLPLISALNDPMRPLS